MTNDSSTHPCKICAQPAAARHTRSGVTFFHCPACNLLFNTYWDNQPTLAPAQITANDRRRDEWPAGAADHMHEKGWDTLEYMGWPLYWWSRQVHAVLKKVPGYETWVRRSIKKKFAKLLDFGCGHGVTVTELRTRDGFDVMGLDPFSPVDRPYIIRQPLIDRHLEDNTFDAIFSIETLEHIPNILETFNELCRILKPGGVLLVQTRRLEDPDYHDKQDQWFYLDDPTTHITIYSRPAMRRIANKTGWSSVSFRGVRLARFVK